MEIDREPLDKNILPLGVKGVKRFKPDSNPVLTGQEPVSVSEKSNQSLQSRQIIGGTDEFQFPSPELDKFFKAGKFTTVDEIMEVVTTTNSQKRDSLATAELCPLIGLPKLVINKGNIKSLYGWDSSQHTYLYPEEALYLIETGKLEVLTDRVPLSIERGRLLLLGSGGGTRCTVDDYIVYKHFMKLGYRLRRRPEYQFNTANASLEQRKAKAAAGFSSTSGADIENEDFAMDEGGDRQPLTATRREEGSESLEDIQMLPSISSFRGTKRRADAEPNVEGDRGFKGSDSDSSIQSMEAAAIVDDDSDCEFIETVEKDSKWDVFVRVCDEMSIAEVSMDEGSIPDSSPSEPSPQPYVVAESDSDVEFVDEVLFSHVTIEEITYEEASSIYCEPGPSTSKQQQVTVDLVSSESEEDESIGYEPIWSKCVPNTKIQLTFPPPCLLPENIHARDDLVCYEYNLFNQDTSDLEIETIVDSFRIDINLTQITESNSVSWKEWRQNAMAEAKDVFNASLIGKAQENSGGNSKKLNHWKLPNSNGKTDQKLKLKPHVPFDLFPPTAGQVNKHKLGVIIKSTHRVAVTRENELVPDAMDFPGSEDEAPVLVTVIGEDSNIINLICNNSPIPSLF